MKRFQVLPGVLSVVVLVLVGCATTSDVDKKIADVQAKTDKKIESVESQVEELQEKQKSFELAVLFVRLYRSLDAIVGGDDAVASIWLRNRNAILGIEPLGAIQTVPGLMHVIQYLDARRAVV